MDELLQEVRAVVSAMRAGEHTRAAELMTAARLPRLAASGEIPAGEEGRPLREAVAEALALAESMRDELGKQLGESGAGRRAHGAYRRKR